MTTLLYDCQDLTFSYRLGGQRVPALRGVTLQVPRGAFVCLTGPSGSGKSTFLNLLGLIEPVQGGRLLFEGTDLGTLPEAAKNRLRRHKLGFVFQSFHLLEVLDAYENVEFFLTRQGVAAAERARRVEDALRAVDLWEHRLKRPGEMSGGQRQRVAVARALAKEPAVVIADEPTASLDQENGRQVMQLLRALADAKGVTVLVSSHDPMVLRYATEERRLVDGRLA